MSRIQFSRLLTDTGRTYATRTSGEAWQALNTAPWELTDPTPEKGSLVRPVVGRFDIPVAPSKLIGIGKNYRAHAAEMGGPVPSEPLMFLKAPSSLTAHASSMELPTLSERVDYEGELAVVIGRKARAVDVDTALDYVLGYVAACDITARDLQTKDGQWARAKSFDGFCPIGPVITRNIDLRNSVLETRVNGKVCQRASLSEMVFSVAEIISHVSTAMTLLPGDVILTGTPDGVGPLRPGDRVVVSITGLEELEFDVSSTRAL